MNIGVYRRLRVEFISKSEKVAARWKGGVQIITSLVTLIALLSFLPVICPFKHPVIARSFCNGGALDLLRRKTLLKRAHFLSVNRPEFLDMSV